MIWQGVWSRCNSKKGGAPIREQARSHKDHRVPVGASLLAKLLKGERQRRIDRLPLRQAQLELHRIVNQHILPGERLRGDQA